MSKAIVNKRDRFLWDNCHEPSGNNTIILTEEEYEALESPDASTIYIIVSGD